MQIICGKFRPDDYVVIRSFGKTRRFEVTQGNHTFFGVVCIRVLESPQDYRMRKFRSTVTGGKVSGHRVPLRWYSPKSRPFLDLLSGRPRLYAVTERREARAIARSLPDVTLLDLSVEAYQRFPLWLQFILLFPAAFALRALWICIDNWTIISPGCEQEPPVSHPKPSNYRWFWVRFISKL